MGTRVTEDDLRAFASVGFPASVRAEEDVEADRLAEAVLHVLAAPSARLAQAVVLALDALAASDHLAVLADQDLSEASRRRLGYLAERLASDPACSHVASDRLSQLSERLYDAADADRAALTFLAKTTPALLRLRLRDADSVSRRWNVYGGATLPPESQAAG